MDVVDNVSLLLLVSNNRRVRFNDVCADWGASDAILTILYYRNKLEINICRYDKYNKTIK